MSDRDKVIEAMAMDMHGRGGNYQRWAHADEDTKGVYRTMAGCALDAALAVRGPCPDCGGHQATEYLCEMCDGTGEVPLLAWHEPTETEALLEQLQDAEGVLRARAKQWEAIADDLAQGLRTWDAWGAHRQMIPLPGARDALTAYDEAKKEAS